MESSKGLVFTESYHLLKDGNTNFRTRSGVASLKNFITI